jgi:hypothetical protein
MGYTHYWRQQRDFTEQEWIMAKNAFTEIVKTTDIILVGPHGEKDTDPICNDDKIWFNGLEDDSHETFGIEKKMTSDFEFCKTACKPYDDIVTALLYFIKTEIPDVMIISSDGSIDGDDWETGRDIVSKIL